MPDWMLFTDLDGTLLDAETYAADGSREALRRLQKRGIPVLFCSAKTNAEQRALREALGVRDPYIVENGSAILFEGDDPVLLGLPAAEIHAALRRIQQDSGLHFQGYADLSQEAVARLTGLPLSAAQRARTRDYSETIITQFSPQQLALFQQHCAAHGLKCPSGGRFYTVTGANADKGRAVRWLTTYYRWRWGDDLVTVGIGDSPNDAPLLAAVDRPFLVQRPGGQWRDVPAPNLTRVPAIGPAGFSWVVEHLLAD